MWFIAGAPDQASPGQVPVIAIARAIPPPTARSAPIASQMWRDRGAGGREARLDFGGGATPSWVTGTRCEDAGSAADDAVEASDPDAAGIGPAPGVACAA